MNKPFKKLGYHVEKDGTVIPITLKPYTKPKPKTPDPQPAGCRNLRRKFPNLYAIMMKNKEAKSHE